MCFPLGSGDHRKRVSRTVIWFCIVIVWGCAPRYQPPSIVIPSKPYRKPRVITETLVVPTHPRTIVHEVAPMETIWRLSKMYQVPMKDILRANGLKPGDVIRVGQKLIIPHARAFLNVINLYPNPQWRYIIIHHTAMEIGNAALIDRSHHNRGFWNGLGYHFLIDNGTLGKGDGQIEMSPRWIRQQCGAHCRASGMNCQGIGIALVGNFDIDTPTESQLRSLAYLIRTLQRFYGIPDSHVLGHGEVPGARTDCPGIHFPWVKLRRYLARY